MPLKRRTAKSRKELTHEQFFELWIGPGGPGVSAFESPFLRRAAWYENKAELMEGQGPGQRPWGFWEFEAQEHPEDEVKALRRMGLLTPSEEAGLKAARELRAPSRDRGGRRRRLVLEGADGD